VVLSPNVLRNVIREMDGSAAAVLVTLNRSGISFATEGELGKIRVGIFTERHTMGALTVVVTFR